MRLTLKLALVLSLSWLSGDAWAFTHVVQKGDTLASLAERYYGRIQHEKLLVAANGLDAQGGSSIIPGMRLEIPALSYHRVLPGETWASLAEKYLGSPQRSDVLAIANDTNPWMPLKEGEQIQIPYNLTLILSERQSLVTISYKYLGNTNKAWILDRYNNLDGRALRRGDVLLIPLTDLKLTPEGAEAARKSTLGTLSEGSAELRLLQKRVDLELPALLADIRSGRYVDAVRRGNQFLAAGPLTHEQLAIIHRSLLHAYVALEAPGLATAACNDWRKYDKQATLDKMWLSPKVIAACERGTPAPAAKSH